MREMATANKVEQVAHEVSVLRQSRRQGRRLAGKQGRQQQSAGGASASAAASATPAASTSRKSKYRVIKKDGRPEPFNRQKLIGGLVRACEKRPVSGSSSRASPIASSRTCRIAPSAKSRRPTSAPGIMDELRRIDQVAYVRFASVYRQFRDVGEFKREIDELQRNKS